jgi:hypothetical protein
MNGAKIASSLGVGNVPTNWAIAGTGVLQSSNITRKQPFLLSIRRKRGAAVAWLGAATELLNRRWY